jgi:hypothetical protein
MSEKVDYTIRTEGKPNSYGLGKTVIPNVVLFEAGFHGLTWEELNAKLKTLPKGTVLR